MKKHPFQLIVALTTLLAAVVTILNWFGITSSRLFHFFQSRMIHLTITELVLIILIPSFLSYRFFAKRYPLISPQVLKEIKARAAKAFNFTKKLDPLIEDWNKLLSIADDIRFIEIDMSHQRYLRSLWNAPKPNKEFNILVDPNSEFILNFEKTRNLTIVELEEYSKYVSKAKLYFNQINKIDPTKRKYTTEAEAKSTIIADIRRILDALESAKQLNSIN